MPAFIISLVAAVGIAICGALVINSMQKNVAVAYQSSTGVRL